VEVVDNRVIIFVVERVPHCFFPPSRRPNRSIALAPGHPDAIKTSDAVAKLADFYA
jgi:hypothetical protein